MPSGMGGRGGVVCHDCARRIAKLMPGVFVAEVHDAVVNTSDIAARAGVAHEAVRLFRYFRDQRHVRETRSPIWMRLTEACRKSEERIRSDDWFRHPEVGPPLTTV